MTTFTGLLNGNNNSIDQPVMKRSLLTTLNLTNRLMFEISCSKNASVICSVRPKREKVVSAEYRIFGHFHRIFGRMFGRITALKLAIFDHNFS